MAELKQSKGKMKARYINIGDEIIEVVSSNKRTGHKISFEFELINKGKVSCKVYNLEDDKFVLSDNFILESGNKVYINDDIFNFLLKKNIIYIFAAEEVELFE